MKDQRGLKATTKHFSVRLLGLSHDDRTNKWEATCRHCGKSYIPLTTMLAWQTLECPGRKCDTAETVNYNELMDDDDGK